MYDDMCYAELEDARDALARAIIVAGNRASSGVAEQWLHEYKAIGAEMAERHLHSTNRYYRVLS